jgi:hypothetical protein
MIGEESRRRSAPSRRSDRSSGVSLNLAIRHPIRWMSDGCLMARRRDSGHAPSLRSGGEASGPSACRRMDCDLRDTALAAPFVPKLVDRAATITPPQCSTRSCQSEKGLLLSTLLVRLDRYQRSYGPPMSGDDRRPTCLRCRQQLRELLPSLFRAGLPGAIHSCPNRTGPYRIPVVRSPAARANDPTTSPPRRVAADTRQQFPVRRSGAASSFFSSH